MAYSDRLPNARHMHLLATPSAAAPKGHQSHAPSPSRGSRAVAKDHWALGLRRVQLLRIDQRSGGGIRPVPYGMAAARSFNPDEARPPERSVSLALDYCLS